jgi:hypothetical protein
MERKLSIRAWKVIRNAVAFVLAFVVVVMMLPTKARSQLGLDPCCAIISAGLTTISNLLSSAVAKPLGAIQQLEQQAANLEQQVVFPVAALNQARGLAGQLQGQFTQMKKTFQLSVSSATLQPRNNSKKICFRGIRIPFRRFPATMPRCTAR